MTRNLSKIIGNTLILLSLLSFAVLAYPLLRAYLFPPAITTSSQPSEAFRIVIPKIHAQAPVVEQVDPWNETVYQEALKHGVAHAENTGLPGQQQTVFLFAHSSGTPWEQVYFNTIFLRLGELRKGDMILLERGKKRYVYTVRESKEVMPNETQYLTNTATDQLILQTCTPIGTSLRRLLVFADPTG